MKLSTPTYLHYSFVRTPGTVCNRYSQHCSENKVKFLQEFMKSAEQKRPPSEEEPKPPRQPGSNEPEPDFPEPGDEVRDLVRPVKSRKAA